MEELEFDDQKDYWTRVLFLVPDDQVATCHLLFSLLVQNMMKGVKKDKQNPFLLIYLEKATLFLKDILKSEKPEKTSFDQTIASFAWDQMFAQVMITPSKGGIAYKLTYLQAVEMIIDHYKEIVIDKTFREYFDDINFNDRGRISSEKAEALIYEYMEKVKEDDHYSLEDDDMEDEEDEEYPPYVYEDSWENVQDLLEEMPRENKLLFHVIALRQCSLCELESKGYFKYQKAVIKAFTTCQSNANPHQKEFAIGNADDALEKMQEKFLNNIEKAYADESINDDTEISREEIFTLAADYSLEKVAALDPEQVNVFLEKSSLEDKNFIVGEELEKYCDEIYQQAESESEEIIINFYDAEGYDDAEEEEVNEDEVPQAEGAKPGVEIKSEKSREDLKQFIKEKVENFDLVHDIFFHVVYLNILVSKEIPEDIYSSYREAVKTAVESYKSKKDLQYKENARKNADKVFLDMVYEIMDRIDHINEEESLESMSERLGYLFVINTLVISLPDIPTIYSEPLELSLTELDYDPERGDFYEITTDAYSLKYMSIVANGLIYDMISEMKEEKDE